MFVAWMDLGDVKTDMNPIGRHSAYRDNEC